MAKLLFEDLKKIKESVETQATLREGGFRARVNIHLGTCGMASGAQKIVNTVLEEIEKHKIKDVAITTSGCAGLCSREPMITVEILGAAPVKYVHLDPEKMRGIFTEHLLGGKVVEKYALAVGSETSD